MPEQLQLIENNFEEVSRLARETMHLLAVSNRRPAPARYLEVMRNARGLQELWACQVQMEHELFPHMLACDRHSASYLKRVAKENEAIGMLLGSLGATPWPRSAQAGLHLIRPAVTQAMTQLLGQVERERITILPLLRRWLPDEVAQETASLALTAT